MKPSDWTGADESDAIAFERQCLIDQGLCPTCTGTGAVPASIDHTGELLTTCDDCDGSREPRATLEDHPAMLTDDLLSPAPPPTGIVIREVRDQPDGYWRLDVSRDSAPLVTISYVVSESDPMTFTASVPVDRDGATYRVPIGHYHTIRAAIDDAAALHGCARFDPGHRDPCGYCGAAHRESGCDQRPRSQRYDDTPY